MKILKGTIIIKLDAEVLQTRRDAGSQDTAIIHELLEKLLSQLDLITRSRVTFHDCEIKEEALPF